MLIIHLYRHRPHKFDHLTDYAAKRLHSNWQEARRYKVDSAKKGLAQIYILNGNSYIVDLKERDCSCGEFQEYLIPCQHAIAACIWEGEDPYSYTHHWYSIENYQLTYSWHIHPIREEDLVEENSECGAPELAKQRGWPKKTRLRRREKGGCSHICSHCGQAGHNWRSCRSVART
jgi:SWIM zinc finger